MKSSNYERGIILTKIKEFTKKNGLDMLAAFFIPVLIMMAVYYTIDVYWNSPISILASDSFSQYANFHASLKNVWTGKENPFYSFHLGMGLNYYAFISYYLGGIFAPLVVFFDTANMPNALYILTLIKIGAGGLAFWIYAKNTFKINRFFNIALAVAYSLMSFTIAQAEVIMWLDAMVWFPLIILGINRLLEFKKPRLLFFSYFLLFISNYYFGFMIGLFSFMYFLVRYFADRKKHKKVLIPYLITSILAGLGSLIMILPMYLDLKANGETLSQITMTKTEDTGFWDIIVKNMIGTYDTTQYGSIPFIYIGIIPFIFCIFYFISRKFDWKHKLGYGLIAVFIIASFYFTPLDLLWQGFHFPNMFLFRYAFLLSFLVIMLAGYALEKFDKSDIPVMLFIGIGLIVAYTLAFFVHSDKSYEFVKSENYVLSMVFLIAYLIIFAISLLPNSKFTFKRISLLILILMGVEAATNSYYMIHGVRQDWNYPSAEQFTAPRPYIKELVNYANKNDDGIFYRLENLNRVSTNDSVNYQYAGMDLFSSVRNRNSAAVLRTLGYKSDGTALNSRYDNNTLLMDSFVGMRYNISETPINRFGFKEIKHNKRYKLYENKYALPLGVETSNNILNTKLIESDNLTSQETLINALTGKKYTFFQLEQPSLVSEEGGKITDNGDGQTSTISVNQGETLALTYSIHVPAGKEAYFSLFPIEGPTGSAKVDTEKQPGHWCEIGMMGQYYDLGYFKKATDLQFTVYISGSEGSFTAITPPVLFLDTKEYKSAMTKLQTQGVDFKVDGRIVKADVNIKKGQNTIFTTIPYDKGWTAYVDGKETPISSYRNGFVTFRVPNGKHEVKLKYFPPGLKIGIVLFILSFIGFFFYDRYIEGKPLKLGKKKK